MKTTVGNIELEIIDEKQHSNDSRDCLSNYEKVYLNDSDYSPSSLFGLKAWLNNELFTTALIGATGGGTGLHERSQIINEDRIVMCCSNSLFCLKLPELELLWTIEVEWATCFEIFEYNQDYIVHGETTVSRISHSGEIIWQQNGSDIFTTLEGIDDFIVTEDYIIATDWDYRTYKFDFDGNKIN